MKKIEMPLLPTVRFPKRISTSVSSETHALYLKLKTEGKDVPNYCRLLIEQGLSDYAKAEEKAG